MRVAAVMTALMSMCGPVDQPGNTRCAHLEPLLELYSPGWDVRRMSAIMARESNCLPTVRSRTRDTGLLQINDVNLPWLTEQAGFPVTVELLQHPHFNVYLAAKLWVYWGRVSGDPYQPWKTTDKGS
jgi:hypothetical protein